MNIRKPKFKNPIVILLIIILLSFTSLGAFLRLGMLPGAEGGKVGVYSVQSPWKPFNEYVIGKQVDPNASVMPSDPYNVRYDPDYSYMYYPDLYISVSKLWTENEVKEPINYWVKNPDGDMVHIKGFVQVLYFKILWRAEPSGDAHWPTWPAPAGISEYEMRWSKAKFWFVIGTTIWDQAFPDPNNPDVIGRVWATPISAYVLSAQKAEGSSQYIYLEPEAYAGRQVTLFSDTKGGSIVDIIGNQEPTNLNDTIRSNWGWQSPDTRMRTGMGFFMFQTTDFGVEWWETWDLRGRHVNYKAAKIEYTIKVYFLVIGKWIYVQEEPEEWEQGQAKVVTTKGFLEMLGDWWTGVITNPLTWIWMFIGTLVLVLIILIILAIFAPGVLGLAGALAGRAAKHVRRKGG